MKFYYLTASLSDCAALNFTFLLAGKSIGAPVLGLRPLRAARSDTLKVPRPETLTSSPFLSAELISSIKDEIVSSVALIVAPVFIAVRFTKSFLFMVLFTF